MGEGITALGIYGYTNQGGVSGVRSMACSESKWNLRPEILSLLPAPQVVRIIKSGVTGKCDQRASGSRNGPEVLTGRTT